MLKGNIQDHFLIEKYVNHCKTMPPWIACADKKWREEDQMTVVYTKAH